MLKLSTYIYRLSTIYLAPVGIILSYYIAPHAALFLQPIGSTEPRVWKGKREERVLIIASPSTCCKCDYLVS